MIQERRTDQLTSPYTKEDYLTFYETLKNISSCPDKEVREKSEAFLKELERIDPKKVIDMAFELINQANPEVWYQGIVYLHYTVRATAQRMINLNRQFMSTLKNTNDERKMTKLCECYSEYLIKPQNYRFRKDYMEMFVENLIKEFTKQGMKEFDIWVFVNVFGGVRKEYDVEGGRLRHQISGIINLLSKREQSNVPWWTWAELVATLSIICKITPNWEWLIDNIKKIVPIRLLLILLTLYNSRHSAIRNLEWILSLMSATVMKLTHLPTIQTIEQNYGTDYVVLALKSVRYLVMDALQIIRNSNNETDLNYFMLASYFTDTQTIASLVNLFGNVLQFYEGECLQLHEIAEQTIRAVLDNIPEQKVQAVASGLFGNQDHFLNRLYYLLSGLTRHLLQFFRASQRLITFAYLSFSQLSLPFLLFADRFLCVHEYLESEEIEKAINQIIHSLMNEKWENITTSIGFKKKAIALRIIIRKQKYVNHDYSQAEKLCAEAFSFAMSIYSFSKQRGFLTQELSETIIDSLTMLTRYPTFKPFIFNHSVSILISFFSSTPVNVCQNLPIITFLIRILNESYSPECQLAPCLTCINNIAYTKNSFLWEQLCELVLGILIKCNLYIYSKPVEKEFGYTVIRKVLFQTVFFAGMKENILKCMDQAIYTSILLETVFHKDIAIAIVESIQIPPEMFDAFFYLDHFFEAMIIVFDIKTPYTVEKDLNNKIQQTKKGILEAILEGLNIEQKSSYQQCYKESQKLSWSTLPILKEIIPIDSIVGSFIDEQLNR